MNILRVDSRLNRIDPSMNIISCPIQSGTQEPIWKILLEEVFQYGIEVSP